MKAQAIRITPRRAAWRSLQDTAIRALAFGIQFAGMVIFTAALLLMMVLMLGMGASV